LGGRDCHSIRLDVVGLAAHATCVDEAIMTITPEISGWRRRGSDAVHGTIRLRRRVGPQMNREANAALGEFLRAF
jgi:hypothetical protein